MIAVGVLGVAGLIPRHSADLSEIDAAERELGVRLPDDYRSFLQQSDGIEGLVGPDAYLILWTVKELAELNRAYNVTEFAPGLVLIGTDGGDTGYGFVEDSRTTYYVQVPLVGMSRDTAQRTGTTLVEAVMRLGEGDRG